MDLGDITSAAINEVKLLVPDAESGASVCATALAYFAAEAGLDHDKVIERLRHDLKTMQSAMNS